jgi:hypothetical protein
MGPSITPAEVVEGIGVPSAVTARSPFLTVGAAARVANVTPKGMLRRLSGDLLPGYRLGRRWFVPEAELSLRLSGAAVVTIAVGEVVRDLVAELPTVLGVEHLEAFLGTRRPQLYEVLRFPALGGRRGQNRITTQAVLAAALAQARNGCPPVRGAFR